MRELPIVEVRHAPSCVRQVPVFARLDPALQDAVASLARPRRLRRGEVLHRAGDPLASLYVVHTGRLRVDHTYSSGRRRLLRVAGPGEVVGEHSFLTGQAPDYGIEALEDAGLCAFGRDGLTGLMATQPDLALGMLRAQSDRLADAERRLALATVEVEQRVAAFLLDLPVRRAEGDLRVELPWPKKDIAAFLGTTPESFSRALSRLTREGIVTVDGACLTLLDPDALEAKAAS